MVDGDGQRSIGWVSHDDVARAYARLQRGGPGPRRASAGRWPALTPGQTARPAIRLPDYRAVDG